MAKGKQEINKTVCPVTRKEFLDNAKPLAAVIEGSTYLALPKQFSTGSVGFFHQGKIPVTINGKTVTMTMQVSLQAVGSKELPADA